MGVILYEILYGCHPLKLNQNKNELDVKFVEKFWNKEIKIDFPKKPKEYNLIKTIMCEMLEARPEERITWRKLRSRLTGYVEVDHILFEPSKHAFKMFQTTIEIMFNTSSLIE